MILRFAALCCALHRAGLVGSPVCFSVFFFWLSLCVVTCSSHEKLEYEVVGGFSGMEWVVVIIGRWDMDVLLALLLLHVCTLPAMKIGGPDCPGRGLCPNFSFEMAAAGGLVTANGLMLGRGRPDNVGGRADGRGMSAGAHCDYVCMSPADMSAP
jgi:hypothetical protein